jgi:2-dehydropantoate 2-reductase
MNQTYPSILIQGTGAMACLFAARLAAAGVPVKMLGSWPEGLKALREQGVRVVEFSGSEQSYPVEVYDAARDCPPIHYALVLVKSWQTQQAARQLTGCLAEDGLALTLQNGLGNREKLVQALGASRVSLGVTTAGATLLGPGRVRPAGTGVVSLAAHPRLAPLAELLRAAGFIVENAPEAAALLWGKLVINAGINPITALLGVTNGEILARKSARALLASTVREAAAVAVAKGIRLPYPDPVIAAEAIARSTANNRSSMLQDVERGAPTEIDAINGAIVTAGDEAGIPAPVNRTLWHFVKAKVEY